MEIESRRSLESDALLYAHAGFAVPGLITTTFMAHSAHLSRAAGRFSFDRLERGVLPLPERWLPPGLSAQDFKTRLTPRRLESSKSWPFRQDAPLGDFGLNDGPKWWTHGQVHALLGGGFWDELSEWELMHMARLSEAVASWHWYWLSELDRRYCDLHSVTTSDQTPDCEACRGLEREASISRVRLERLQAPEALDMARNSLSFLTFEAHCYAEGLTRGELVVPEGPYLSMEEACDYARRHRERLVSPAHRRWVRTCLTAGEDYATSLDDFSARAATLCEQLITPITPPNDVSIMRSTRVLQDLGARLCQAAALMGDPESGFSQGLEALMAGLEGLRALEEPTEVDALMRRTLACVTSDLQSAPTLASTVLALGYRPTQSSADEPNVMRHAREDALMRRASAMNSPLRALLSQSAELREALIVSPRSPDLLRDLRLASERLSTGSVEAGMVAAFVSWLSLVATHWQSTEPESQSHAFWYYRLALPSLPPASHWAQVRLRPNPYLTTVACPFALTWLDALLTQSSGDPGPPKASSAPAHVLVGPGRHGPLLLPWTDTRRALMDRLQHTPTLDALLEEGFTREALSQAIDEELVIALQARDAKTLYVQPLPTHSPTPSAPPGSDVREDPGPWEQDAQARYYKAFCVQNPLYRELSEALATFAEIDPSHEVVDLGCGTGITSQAILSRLGPQGRLLAVDPAPRMIRASQEALDDPRVSFEVGTARRMLQVAGPRDRIVCNSAIWLDPNILIPLKASQMILKPQGRLCFSIPAEYLGHREHWETETGQKLARSLSAVRSELMGVAEGSDHLTPTPHADYLGSLERLSEIVAELGFATLHA